MKLLFGLLVLTFSSLSFGQLQPGDSQYLKTRSFYGEVFVPTDEVELAGIAAPYLKFFHNRFDRIFGYELHEEVSYTITSTRNQIPNAFARPFPFLSHYIYRGNNFLERSASSSWLELITAHEIAHLYQLDAKSETPLLLNRTFGNTPFVFPLPVFLYPNIVHPLFVLEGHAVWVESFATAGGRLHSGEVRAMAHQLLTDPKYDLARLMNNNLFFPLNQDKYNVGAYVFEHLAKAHSFEKTNSLFLTHGERWFTPFLLSFSFENSFNQSTRAVFNELKNKTLLKDQQFTRLESDKVLASSFSKPHLIRDQERVRFVINRELQEDPEIFEINSKGEVVFQERPQGFPNGPLLKVGGQYFGSISFSHTVRDFEFGVFDQKFFIVPETRGQLLTDQKGLKFAFIDIPSSFESYRIGVKEGFEGEAKYFDQAVSSPRFSDSGDVFYFRQEGAEKVCMKNDQEIFRFPGQYAVIADIVMNDQVHFIANTESGVGAFVFDGKTITRSLPFDNIVDVKVFAETKTMIAMAITENGYDVHALDWNGTLDAEAASPFVVEVAGRKEFLETDGPALAQVAAEVTSEPDFSDPSFWGMRWSNILPSIGGSQLGAQASFADNLNFHSLFVSGAGSLDPKDSSSSFGFAYAFSRYIWTWSLEGSSSNNSLQSLNAADLQGCTTTNQLSNCLTSVGQNSIALSVSRPLYVDGLWRSSLSFDLSQREQTLRYQRPQGIGDVGELDLRRTVLSADWVTTYNRSYGRGYLPYRFFGARLGLRTSEQLESAGSASAQFSYGFGDELYLSGTIFGDQSLIPTIEVTGSEVARLQQLFDYQASDARAVFYDQTFAASQLKLTKMFDRAYALSSRTILSLRRMGVFGQVEWRATDSDLNRQATNQEFIGRLGLAFELILNHNVVAPLELGIFQNPTQQVSGVNVFLNLREW